MFILQVEYLHSLCPEIIEFKSWYACLHTGSLVPMDVDPPFDATGLKEIGNLASWTVSTYKPGCGVEALRDEDTNMFWQYVHI